MPRACFKALGSCVVLPTLLSSFCGDGRAGRLRKAGRFVRSVVARSISVAMGGMGRARAEGQSAHEARVADARAQTE